MDKRTQDWVETLRSMARSELDFAEDDKRRKYGTVESIQIHLANATAYAHQADLIEKGEDNA